MNRLSPLIVRRFPAARPAVSQRTAGAADVAIPLAAPTPFANLDIARWSDDLRLFATGWIGGLIFFGTLLG